MRKIWFRNLALCLLALLFSWQALGSVCLPRHVLTVLHHAWFVCRCQGFRLRSQHWAPRLITSFPSTTFHFLNTLFLVDWLAVFERESQSVIQVWAWNSLCDQSGLNLLQSSCFGLQSVSITACATIQSKKVLVPGKGHPFCSVSWAFVVRGPGIDVLSHL